MTQTPSFILLLLGFGFVVFFHELGHFLAAKWVDIKVEQFAVGFGPAIIAWRRGWDSDSGHRTVNMRDRIHRHLESKEAKGPDATFSDQEMADGGAALNLGETEYRLNWIPLGGYVKMLGQDDLKANAEQNDPRAYNKKSIGARMVVVSAGVIMNVLLAVIGFIILFTIGFKVPPAVVGGFSINSPAQRAGLQPGDLIIEMDGHAQTDFTKLALSTALSSPGDALPIVLRRNGQLMNLTITPTMEEMGQKFLMLGVENPSELRGLELRTFEEMKKSGGALNPERLALNPDDVVIAINGADTSAAVDRKAKSPDLDGLMRDVVQLDRALQESDGNPVKLTVRSADGKQREVSITPHMETVFGAKAADISIAGFIPRAVVMEIPAESTAKDLLQPNDVITGVVSAGDPLNNPTTEQLQERIDKAGQGRQAVDVQVLRDGKPQTAAGIRPTIKLADPKDPDRTRYAMGIHLDLDMQHTVAAGVAGDSPAGRADIPAGATILSVGGVEVKSWFNVRTQLMAQAAGRAVAIGYTDDRGKDQTANMTLDQSQIDALKQMRFTHIVPLRELEYPRLAKNSGEAMRWGVIETRDFILQFYVTIKRMFQGSISPKNMMGPVGMVQNGTKIASKGTDWLIWFLSMISANLAVVNFLPIPVVDGGLFTFLLLEKIQGKPLSPKAQSVAQVVGLALLLSIFLFVTYHDILRAIWS